VCDAVWCGIRMAIHFSEERTASMLESRQGTSTKLEVVRSSEA